MNCKALPLSCFVLVHNLIRNDSFKSIPGIQSNINVLFLSIGDSGLRLATKETGATIGLWNDGSRFENHDEENNSGSFP